ncbi:AbiH family protein [Pseudoalteromonas sp. R86517]
MKLYVIGNGFDVHHGLDTRYTSFGLYLKLTTGKLMSYCLAITGLLT